MKKRIINSLKLTGKIFLISAVCFFGIALLTSIFDFNADNFLILYNPFISGFLHVNLDHLFCNILGIFIFSLAGINSHYTLKNIFWITFFISLAYLPIPILGIFSPAVGLSGTCMFLMARYFLTWKRLKGLGICIISLIVLSEALSILDDDGISHGVHLLGAIFGLISLRSKRWLSL